MAWLRTRRHVERPRRDPAPRGRDRSSRQLDLVRSSGPVVGLVSAAASVVVLASSCLVAAPRPAQGAHAREVDAELLGGAQQVVVLVAHLGALALLGDDVDVERQRLHLLEQHLEGLGDRRLGDVLALDDRLVGLHAPDGVVGLDREHLLQRVGGAEGLQRPHLHLAEALAAELRLAAQRLLGDQRVGAGRAGVDLVVDEVQQLEDVHVADRHLLLERLAGAAVEQRHLARGLLAVATGLVDVHADRAPCVRPATSRARRRRLRRSRRRTPAWTRTRAALAARRRRRAL